VKPLSNPTPAYIVFGLGFDYASSHSNMPPEAGVWRLGPQGFVRFFEESMGLGTPADDTAYLRIEQFRQFLQLDLEEQGGAFYQASFLADPFAVAEELLSRRDELLLAGWDFLQDDHTPERLAVLTRLKARETGLAPGFADRFDRVYQALGRRHLPVSAVEVQLPADLLPPVWQRLMRKLQGLGVAVTYGENPAPCAPADSDLGRFQRLLCGTPPTTPLIGDGSLIWIRGKRDTDLAAFIAAWLRKHPEKQPTLLLAGPARSLDNALVLEGLPSLGLQSISLARPALQALKLVPVFLWEPLDPYKVMEFLSLSLKPLDEELALRIARQMAQTPGVFSESWQQMLGQCFATLEAEGGDVQAARAAYRFWFERKRYDSQGSVPKPEAIAIFKYLSEWAYSLLRNGEGAASLGILGAQAARIVELLEALPEHALTRLQLERIVRTIYEPAPIQLRPREAGSLPIASPPAALYESTDELLWWHFAQTEPDYFFSRWSKKERLWLQNHGVETDTPDFQNRLLVWQRKLPVFQTQKRLLLVQPTLVEGKEAQPHPLLADLEAGFGKPDAIHYDMDAGTGLAAPFLHPLPDFQHLPIHVLGKPNAFIKAPPHAKLDLREAESFSSLQTLLYYPYQWVFRHKLQLRQSDILSILDEGPLYGNLAHRYFELLLQHPELSNWSASDIEAFIDQLTPDLLRKEGATLLLYGREPEQVRLVRKVKRAAVRLIDLIQRNGWSVSATEKNLEGQFSNRTLKARADLLLERPGELAVLDLKWSGAHYREALIRNEEDLQLALYTFLLQDAQLTVHSAYYILERERLIARNQAAFREVQAVSPGADQREVCQRILARIEATLQWRTRQLAGGFIEVRSKQTYRELERSYCDQDMMPLLEMPTENAPFDEYKTLVNLLH
jgi:hypothetical protein